MKKILFLILIILTFSSCENERKDNTESDSPATTVSVVKYTNKTTNTYLFLSYTNYEYDIGDVTNVDDVSNLSILKPFKDKQCIWRTFVGLSIIERERYGDSDASDVVNNYRNIDYFTENLDFILYDNQTNFLFKITNRLSLLVEYSYLIPGFEYGGDIEYAHIISIDDSILTNTYFGTTNE